LVLGWTGRIAMKSLEKLVFARTPLLSLPGLTRQSIQRDSFED
jgi:hypothetical protein